jgi:hypothetical protein
MTSSCTIDLKIVLKNTGIILVATGENTKTSLTRWTINPSSQSSPHIETKNRPKISNHLRSLERTWYPHPLPPPITTPSKIESKSVNASSFGKPDVGHPSVESVKLGVPDDMM